MQGVADRALEDRAESDEVPVKVRKCSGKRSEEWNFLEDIGGTREKAQEALTDICKSSLRQSDLRSTSTNAPSG